MLAAERRHDVVVFSRDRDGAKNRERQTSIDAVVADAPMTHPKLKIVGAVAVETLEAWVLAAAGDAHSESYTDPGRELSTRFDVPAKDTDAMVALVAQADLAQVPASATSLHRWLESARSVFSTDQTTDA